MVVERSLQELPPSVQSAHHRADRASHDLRDLFVRELFDIAENDREPKLGWQRVERPLDLFFDQGHQRQRLRLPELPHRTRADPPVRQGVGVGAVEHRALQTAAAVLVDERVGQDPKEPSLQVRAGMELVPGPHRLDECVLDEILGFRRISRELAGYAVHGVQMSERLVRKGIGLRCVRYG